MDEYSIEKPKGKKLKVWQKIILSLFIVAMIIVVSAFVMVAITSSDDSNEPVINEVTTTIYDTVIEVEKGEDDFVETDISPINITLSDKELDKFENYLYEYVVDYDYGDVYAIDVATDYMNSHIVNAQSHKYDVRVNGVLDADELYKIVKQNNKAFMEDEENMTCWYEEYSNRTLKDYCLKIVEMLNGIHEKYPMTDMDEVCCYLHDLKILDKITALDFAAVELENKILHINEDMIESWADFNDIDKMQEQILYHEMMHIFQVACDCNQSEGELRIGISHEYDDLEMNPYRWYWLAESAAEMNSCEYLGMDYTTYKYKIGYANTCNLILNLGSSSEVGRIQDLYFDRNANIYELFDISDREKEEFIKMMYSIEILQQEPRDFRDWYEKEYNLDFTKDREAQVKMNLDIKEDYLISLTKLFYRNLARKVTTNNATLQDVFYLMRIYECDLQFHIGNDEVAYMVYLKDIFPKYLEIRSEFFKTIARANGFSEDELQNQFASYSMNVKSGENTLSPNAYLKFLTSEQQDAINSYCKLIYKKGYPNMAKAYEICQEWLVKAPYENVVFNE